MRRPAAIVMVSLLAALAGVMFSTTGAAGTACSATLTVSGPGLATGRLQVTPATASVKVGDCVSIRNASNPSEPVAITITRAGKTVYTTTIPRGQTVSGARGFAPDGVGSYALTATATQPLGFVVHGHATITAKPGPTTTPSASHTPTSTKSSPAKGGGPAHPSKSAGAGKNGKNGKNNKHSPKPHATGIKLPPLPPLPTGLRTAPLPKGSNPLVAPGPSTAAPVTETATPVAAIYRGPIEPVVDNTRGLPIVIGVLVVLGVATGWGRVLLATATPVDRRSSGGVGKRRGGGVGKRRNGSVDKRRNGDHSV